MLPANTNNKEISVIDSLAMEARALRTSIDLNMWQLARVFAEAKPLVPHGEWGQWLKDNADCSQRTAQDMIAAYRRFGGKPQFENIGRSKAFKLLPLPEEAEDAFMETHNVASMSAREVEEAVKKVRAELADEIERERDERINAEARAANANAELKALKEAASKPEIPPELTRELEESREKLAAAREEIDRMKETGETALEESRRIAGENSRLKQEIRDQQAALEEQQEDLNRAQAELLNVKSAIAKGDAERVPSDQLTPEAFAAAVRTFIGAVARLPHMRVAFGTMDSETKEEYFVLLETVEKWAKDSRRALETTGAEGTVI